MKPSKLFLAGALACGTLVGTSALLTSSPVSALAITSITPNPVAAGQPLTIAGDCVGITALLIGVTVEVQTIGGTEQQSSQATINPTTNEFTATLNIPANASPGAWRAQAGCLDANGRTTLTDIYSFTVAPPPTTTTTTTTTSTVPQCVPAAVDDAYTTPRDTRLDVPTPGVLVNDRHCGMSVFVQRSMFHGSVVLNAAGGFDYTPDQGFVGVDQFEYVIGGISTGLRGLQRPEQVDDAVGLVTITVAGPGGTTSSTTPPSTTPNTTVSSVPRPTVTTTPTHGSLPPTR